MPSWEEPIAVSRVILIQQKRTYQWLDGFEIFDFIVAEVEMWQHETVLESTEAIANSVITKFQPLEFWQLGKTFERGKANIDQAQWLQVDVFITQTFNLCGTRIVEIQFFNLESNAILLLQSVCISYFLHFLPPHNNAALSYYCTFLTKQVWRYFDASDRAGTSCSTSGQAAILPHAKPNLKSFSNPIFFIFLGGHLHGNYAKNSKRNRFAKLLQGLRKSCSIVYASAYWQHSAPLPPHSCCSQVLPLCSLCVCDGQVRPMAAVHLEK